MERSKRLALELDCQISAVITAMRQNAKWAVVPGKYNEEDHMEPEPHYEDFRNLRRKIFEWEDWSAVQPLEFLSPFLQLVREPEVSGPITGVALTSLWRLLSSGILGLNAAGAPEAVNAIVEDTTQCKFEATSPASDEVVLFNILQVLQAAIRCEAGVYLTNESVCKAYQAAFMLGKLDADARSNRNSREVSELLTHYSRQIMGEITTVVFERLQYIQPGSPAADEAAAAAGVLPHISSVVAAAAAEAAAAKAAAAAEAAAAEAAAAEAAAAAAAQQGEQQQGGEDAAAGGPFSAAAAVDGLPEAGVGVDGGVQQQGAAAAGGGVSVLSTSPLPKAGSLSDARSPGVAAAVAAAAASAAAGASSGGAPPPLAAGGVGGGVVSRQQQQQGGSSIAASEGAVSDTGATIASSTTAGGLDSVSLADSALAGGVGAGSAQHPLVGVPGPANLSALKTGGAAAAAATAAYYSHGLPCAVEVLSFLIDCIAQRRGDGDGMGGAGGAGGGGSGAGGAGGMSSGGPPDDEYAMFGLSMVHRAVLAGGAVLQSHEALLTLLHKDLFAAMVVASQSASLGVVAGICQVLLALWKVLGACSVLQVEAVLQNVLLRLADGKESSITSPELQEAALEGLLDLCRCPGFLHAMYLSCDCRVERSNLFEDLVSLISKTAFPGGSGGGKGLGPLHLISLEALLSVLQALSERLDDPPPQLQPMTTLERFIDVWGPICRGEDPPLDLILGGDQAAAALAAAAAAGGGGGSKAIRDSASSGGYSTYGAVAELRRIASASNASGSNQQQQQQHRKGRSSGSRLDVLGGGSSSFCSFSADGGGGGGGGPRSSGGQQQQQYELCGVAAAVAAETAAFEKGLKQRVMLAVDHFNKDYKKGFQFLQANHLLPTLKQTPPPAPASTSDTTTSGDADGSTTATTTSAATAAAAASNGNTAAAAAQQQQQDVGVDEDELARCVGYFLRTCPGLSKVTIGELLGDPDKFFLKVLEEFTNTFDFEGLSFDAGLRMFLESFKLPGEAQKIDRIINCFGRAYFAVSPNVFANEDAAYILAYSVIMLNTDRHNNQVKKKMEEVEFCRNLRGVNDGKDFPKEFLSHIYHSICTAPLAISDTVGALTLAGPSAGASWGLMADRASTPRGCALLLPPEVRHCFDTMMFRSIWGPCVHALGVVLEHAEGEGTARAALDGLQLAARLGAHYDIEGVADSAVLVLAKFTNSLNPSIPKPRVAFGRDPKACAAVEAMLLMVNRYGDNIRSSWSNVLELVLRLDKLDLLPPALEALIDADVWGVGPPQQPAVAPVGSSSGAAAAAGVHTPSPTTVVGGEGGGTAGAGAGAANGNMSGSSGAGADASAAGSQQQQQQPAAAAVSRPLQSARQRRAAAGAAGGGRGRPTVGVGGAFLRSVTQLIALQEPEYEAKYATQLEKECEASALEVLHHKCAIQDVFADSRFLKQEALQALVAAIIAAPGPLPRPPSTAAAAGGGGADSRGGEGGGGGHHHHKLPDRSSSGPPLPVDWDAAELCLDLLLVVLLRNRDRLPLLWPPVFDHLASIIRGKGVEGTLVAAGTLGLLRLCQRLLPCKPEAAELLLRGLQLVPSVDPEVAWLNAEVIAAEMLALVQVAAPQIKAQWAWASACNLIKMTSVRPEAFPVSLEALWWVVVHNLTPLNYVLALEASIWFIERAAMEHPKHKERCLQLLPRLNAWLEGWSCSLAGAGLSPEQLLTFSNAKSEFWLYLVEMLSKLTEHPDLQVRSTATSTLQTAVVSAEVLGVLPGSLERGLREWMLPPLEALSKKMGGKGKRELPQADVTVAELVRVVGKAMLLHLPQLVQQPGFAGLWVGVLNALAAAAAAGPEGLNDAAAAALQNLIIMLHEMGVLHPGWSDSQHHNLWQHTWHVAHKLSSNLTPQMLSPPALNPATRQLQQQQQQGLAGLPQVALPQQQHVGGGIVAADMQAQQQQQQFAMMQQQQIGQQQQPYVQQQQYPGALPVVVDAAVVGSEGQQQLQPQVQQQAAH